MQKRGKLAQEQADVRRRWTTRRRGGRPPRKLAKADIFRLAWQGYSDQQIAKVLNCDPRTLRAHGARTLETARRARADADRHEAHRRDDVADRRAELMQAVAQKYYGECLRILTVLLSSLRGWSYSARRLRAIQAAVLEPYLPPLRVDVIAMRHIRFAWKTRLQAEVAMYEAILAIRARASTAPSITCEGGFTGRPKNSSKAPWNQVHTAKGFPRR